MKPPYFFYLILPNKWADWCCETPEHLTWVFSGAALVVSVIAILIS